MSARQLHYGGVPVPYTVSWTAEDRHSIAFCRFAGRLAYCMASARGEGKPVFGKPHMNRQREAIVLGLCDLCGHPLKGRTKVSLSHARWRGNALIDGTGTGILQVEPLLHRDCAGLCLRHCPSLRRDVAAGTLRVRQVTRCRTQIAIVDPAYIQLYVPSYTARVDDRIAGYAKVELLDWRDRDAEWLGDA